MDKFITEKNSLDPFRCSTCNFNVYTARLNVLTYSVAFITSVIQAINLNSYMIFQETSKKKVKHLHIYMTTSLGIRRIQQILTKQLPDLKGSQKSTHVCYQAIEGKGSPGVLKDENLWKSKTYIAKEGNLIASKGFSPEDIQEFYRIGSSLQKSSKIRGPVYQQIISIYKLNKSSPLEDIIKSVYDYYDIYRARKYPNHHIITNLIEQLKFNLNEEYFQNWKKNSIQSMITSYNYKNQLESKVYDSTLME